MVFEVVVAGNIEVAIVVEEVLVVVAVEFDAVEFAATFLVVPVVTVVIFVIVVDV